MNFGFLDNKISGSINFYQKNTTDLLIPVPVTQTSGVGSVLKNAGELENRGIELALSTINVQTSDFSWTTDFNVALNEQEIINLNGQRLIQGANAFIEGEAPGSFYLPDYAGVNSETGEANYLIEQTDITGLVGLGVDTVTSNYNDALNDRRIVGNPNPKYFGGLVNNLSYKGFNLAFTFQFVYDVDIYWETGEFISNSGFLNYSQTKDQLDRWYGPSDLGANPAVRAASSTSNPSSRWIVDGSYLRLNNVTLSYTLNDDILPWGRYVTVYVGGQNLFTWSDYPGYDPDVNSVDPNGGALAQNINRGIDFFTAPQPRVYTAGIKIGF